MIASKTCVSCTIALYVHLLTFVCLNGSEFANLLCCTMSQRLIFSNLETSVMCRACKLFYGAPCCRVGYGTSSLICLMHVVIWVESFNPCDVCNMSLSFTTYTSRDEPFLLLRLSWSLKFYFLTRLRIYEAFEMPHWQNLFLLCLVVGFGVFNLSFTCDATHIIQSSNLVAFTMWLLWSYHTFIDSQSFIIVRHVVVALNFKACKCCATRWYGKSKGKGSWSMLERLKRFKVWEGCALSQW